MPIPNESRETLWQRYARKIAEHPFGRLVQHFITKTIRGDARTDEFDFGIGALLGLAAAPGGLMALTMLDKYSTFLDWLRRRPQLDIYTASIADKYLLIVFAMVFTAIVTALKWDRILPDRQDFLNLAALPLASWRIFAASLAAMAVVVGVFILDVNAAASIMFPLVVAAGQPNFSVFTSFAAAHLSTVILASFFSFCAVFSFQGAAMAVLPRRVFRAVSPWLRGLIVAAALAIFMTCFTGGFLVKHLETHPGSAVRWMPSIWFLGLYQSMQGRASVPLESAASMARMATAGAAALMLCAYGLSYRRIYRRTDEVAAARRAWRLRLDWLGCGEPFSRAILPFVLKTLIRSEVHALTVGSFLAAALVIGAQVAIRESAKASTALPSVGWVSIPLVVAYLGLCGLRLAFDIPAGIEANWVFRAALPDRGAPAHSLARRVMLLFLLAIVVIPALVLFGARWGVATGLCVAAFVLVLSYGLIELLLKDYAKIPFTCSLPQKKEKLPALVLGLLVGLALFAGEAARLGRAVIENPPALLILPIVLMAIRYVHRWFADETLEAPKLTFDEAPTRAVHALDLAGNG